MEPTTAPSWQESLAHTYAELASRFISHAPRLAGAIALLLVGLIVAQALRVVSRKLVAGLDALIQRTAGRDGTRPSVLKDSYGEAVGRVVFWTTIIFSITAATHLLGWRLFSTVMDSVVAYLPALITGLAVILVGFLFGGAARAGVATASRRAGIGQGELLARIVQFVVVLTAFVIGIEQIGINVRFLSTALVVVLGVLLAGGALAFGLGARALVANIIGAQYVRRYCRIGEHLRIGDVEGSVIEITQTSIVLDTESGRTVVPAQHFHERVSRFTSGSDEAAGSNVTTSRDGGRDE